MNLPDQTLKRPDLEKFFEQLGDLAFTDPKTMKELYDVFRRPDGQKKFQDEIRKFGFAAAIENIFKQLELEE